MGHGLGRRWIRADGGTLIDDCFTCSDARPATTTGMQTIIGGVGDANETTTHRARGALLCGASMGADGDVDDHANEHTDDHRHAHGDSYYHADRDPDGNAYHHRNADTDIHSNSNTNRAASKRTLLRQWAVC